MTVSTWAAAFGADINTLACGRTWPATDSREDVWRRHRCGVTSSHDQCVCRYCATPRPAGRSGR